MEGPACGAKRQLDSKRAVGLPFVQLGSVELCGGQDAAILTAAHLWIGARQSDRRRKLSQQVAMMESEMTAAAKSMRDSC